MKFLYDTILGRLLLKIMLSSGFLKLCATFVKSKYSRCLIKGFIKRNNIDVTQFEDRKYESYADFFIREKKDKSISNVANTLISPCDGLLSVFDIDNNSKFTVKGIEYKLDELIPADEARNYIGGMCLIFRLEAKDYHHFCYIDDCIENGATLIPGTLHSVQPIVLDKIPVFRQNKRYYHRLDTVNFGPVMQIEVGAVLVGGVCYEVEKGAKVVRGQKAGRFELCGSTIMMLFTQDASKRVNIYESIQEVINNQTECPVKYGQDIANVN